VSAAILLGGDTDTIAAMAGAIAGARGGVRSLPVRILAQLDDGIRGRTDVSALARRLYDVYAARNEIAKRK
jgi:poly(ADP-ribose) glycohydrolase ARH3